MSSLPKNVGMLGGIISFCGGLLAALLCNCAPLAAARKAAVCAVTVAVVAWLCTYLALGVLSEGVRQRRQENSTYDNT
jgi:nitrate/nitrite transporter NarK